MPIADPSLQMLQYTSEIHTPSDLIKSKVASEKVEVGDIVVIPGIVYDSRSGISKVTNENAATGISHYLPGKAIRFRHVDPNDEHLSFMGQVSKTAPVVEHLKDEKEEDYMRIVTDLEFEAFTPAHATYLTRVIAEGVGLSLGWMENSVRFLPHEISATPKPKCRQCNTIPGSELILRANTAELLDFECCACKKKALALVGGTAEGDPCSKSGGETVPDDDNKKQLETVLDLHMQIKDKDQEIVGLKAELAETKAELETSVDDKVKELQTEHDKILVGKEAELTAEKEKVGKLEGVIHTVRTMPLRKQIAEEQMGLKGDDAKAKIESLGKESYDDLVIKRDDFLVAGKLAAKKAEKKGEDDGDQDTSADDLKAFLADADGVAPKFEETELAAMSDEKFAEQYLGNVMPNGGMPGGN